MSISNLRGMAKARLRLADQIDDIITRLTNLDFHAGDKRGAKYEEKVFEELLGCDLFWVDEELDQGFLTPGQEMLVFNPNVDNTAKELTDICWPVDTATILRKEAGEYGSEPGHFLLHRVRTVTPQEARGRAQYFPPKMVRFSFAKMFDDGSWYAEDNVCGLLNGRWRMLDRNMTKTYQRGGRTLVVTNMDNQRIRNETHDTIGVTISMVLSRRYQWHVALGHSKTGARILLPTNPAGCLQFFKNRDRETNRLRRSALRHWVIRHYRDTDTSFGLVFVREHLRGKTEFTWSDLECEIFVSAYDLEKNEAFRLEAQHWRSQRKHNSVRVRLKR